VPAWVVNTTRAKRGPGSARVGVPGASAGVKSTGERADRC
jgi:hypothetical protein